MKPLCLILMFVVTNVLVHAQSFVEFLENDPVKFVENPFEATVIHQEHTENIDKERLNQRLSMMKKYYKEGGLTDEEVEELRPTVEEAMKNRVLRQKIIRTENFFVQFYSHNVDGIQFEFANASSYETDNRYSLDIVFDLKQISLYDSARFGLDHDVAQSLEPLAPLRAQRMIAQRVNPSGQPWFRAITDMGALPLAIQENVNAYQVENSRLGKVFFSTDQDGNCVEQLKYSRSNQLHMRRIWGQYKDVEGLPHKKPFLFTQASYDDNGEISEVDIIQYSRITIREDLKDMTLEEFLKDYIDESFQTVQM